MAAVALLVVVAIAGIVVGTMRGKGTPTAPTAPDSTPTAGSPMTATPAAAAAVEAAVKPNQVVFAPGSAQVSDADSEKLGKIAETAKKSAIIVKIASRIESRPDRNDQMELARKRSLAVRQVLEAAGIPLGRMQMDIEEVPRGGVKPAEADRVEVVLR